MSGACLASFAIRSVFVETISESGVSLIFPPNGSLFRRLALLSWVPSDRFPNVIAPIGALRLLDDLLPARCLARPYRPTSASSRSPSFLEIPLRACPALRPRWSLPRGRYCLPPSLTASASTSFFTGLNHTARRARCLRFGSGSPLRRKTRFQLYLRPWLDGVGYPQGFNSRFQLMAASSSTRLGWRTREIGRSGASEIQNGDATLIGRVRRYVRCVSLFALQ